MLFANLAESVAEGRGKAQAESLRATRTSTPAHRVADYDEKGDPDALRASVAEIASADLRLGDVVVVSAGEIIPGDGDIVAGIASVDESAITGESAPVVREHGGDRSAVTGGTRVLSDRIVVRITSKPGETFVDRMIRLVEGAARQKTPNEIALNILLREPHDHLPGRRARPSTRWPPTRASRRASRCSSPCWSASSPRRSARSLSAIGIAGMDRLVQRNVLAMSGRAVEAAGDVTTLLLDKTGTITYGNRRATEFVPVGGDATPPSSLVPRSSRRSPTRRPRAPRSSISPASRARPRRSRPSAEVVPFTAQTRMSGVDLRDGSQLRKGAGSKVAEWVGAVPAAVQTELDAVITEISQSGGTPLVVASRSAARRGARARRRPPQGHRQDRPRAIGSPSCGRWASAPS